MAPQHDRLSCRELRVQDGQIAVAGFRSRLVMLLRSRLWSVRRTAYHGDGTVGVVVSGERRGRGVPQMECN
jgi:hypothetical protein